MVSRSQPWLVWFLGPVLWLSQVAGAQPDASRARSEVGVDPRPTHPVEAGTEAARQPLPFLPSWSPDAFDFRLGPILGVRARSTSFGGKEYDTIASEIGLGARIRGIPLIPKNPGITIEPYGSYTWGNRTEKQKAAALSETESSGFQRYWYGFVSRFYFNFLRYSLDYGQGKINYDDKIFVDLEANRWVNDFAILLLPYLSAHYTLSLYELEESRYAKPSIEEIDHWFHLRMAFSLFDFWLDLGPGFTTREYFGQTDPAAPFAKIATIDESYLKALAAFNLVWRLGASGSIKYVYDADSAGAINDTIDQLPNETLSENKSLAHLPKGSIEGSAFFGIRQLLAGFGVGWQLYYLELNNDDAEKQISRNQGLVVTYDSGF